jgi:hypothetical protein
LISHPLENLQRVQQLVYLGEMTFTEAMCNGTCDVCQVWQICSLFHLRHRLTCVVTRQSGTVFVQQDVTDAAKQIIALLRGLADRGKAGKETTLIQLIDMWRGGASKRNGLDMAGLPSLGGGEKYTKHDAERLAHKLVLDGVVRENPAPTQHGTVVSYVAPGHRAADVDHGRLRLQLSMADKVGRVMFVV